jgi:hypothetical protein
MWHAEVFKSPLVHHNFICVGVGYGAITAIVRLTYRYVVAAQLEFFARKSESISQLSGIHELCKLIIVAALVTKYLCPFCGQVAGIVGGVFTCGSRGDCRKA